MYALEKSPLYKMRNRRKLANLLGVSVGYLNQLHEKEYYRYSEPKPNGDGERTYTVPLNELKYVQKRVCVLLSRIETPDWVMAGKKKCSYITNAEWHMNNVYVKTMDISKFYDSVRRKYVYKMFAETLKMADDIAEIMTKLVMCEKTLPTGSPSSLLIVYWAYCNMFETINNLAEEYGCTFTLYVDDMTFSSKKPISKELRKQVNYVLLKYSLRAKKSKDHYYQGKTTKMITGVGVYDGHKVVSNNKRVEIIKQFEKCKKYNDIDEIEKLRGKLCSLRQIEPDIFPEIYNFVKYYDLELKTMARKRYYKNQRIRNECK
jgi:hypothetical protein